MSKQTTLEEIRRLAEKTWEGCHHCTDHDKEMWINGFIAGFLNGSEDMVLVIKKTRSDNK